jgi:crotonobetainyl-CoA:carnitine CoA-transferase CaiB-like acyl-CoA transferase
MVVGALATRLLADFGAEVIRIEDRNRLDMPRRLPLYKGGRIRSYGEEDARPDPNKGGMFNNCNRNKLGVTVNMRDPAGRELVERLIAQSSVVTENFAPGVMERWGLTEEHVRALRPDVIYARMSGFGHSGPYADYRSYGPVVQAACGLSHISGLPGREPSGWGLSYMDNQAAYYNSAALMMAILHRNATGVGTDIDVSAVEAGVELLGPVLLDVEANGRGTRRAGYPTGNRLDHPQAAPHGVYATAGQDRWVAIAVFDDDEWAAFKAALGSPALADARYDTLAGRLANEDDLDRAIAAATAGQDCHDLMYRLQAVGVRAGAVQNAEDVNEHDPQMAHRDVFFELDHPVIGEARFEGVPFAATQFAPDHWRSAPLLGEDNEYVFGTILGLGADEIADLTDRGVI